MALVRVIARAGDLSKKLRQTRPGRVQRDANSWYSVLKSFPETTEEIAQKLKEEGPVLLLQSEDGVNAFHAFLRTEFCDENLDFWLAVCTQTNIS